MRPTIYFKGFTDAGKTVEIFTGNPAKLFALKHPYLSTITTIVSFGFLVWYTVKIIKLLRDMAREDDCPCYDESRVSDICKECDRMSDIISNLSDKFPKDDNLTIVDDDYEHYREEHDGKLHPDIPIIFKDKEFANQEEFETYLKENGYMDEDGNVLKKLNLKIVTHKSKDDIVELLCVKKSDLEEEDSEE